MKRTNLEIIFERLIASAARKDEATIEELLDQKVVWEGVRPDLVCHDRKEALDVLRGGMDMDFLINRMELLDAGDKVVLSLQAPGLPDPQATGIAGQIHQVFSFRDGRVVHIRDFLSRTEALEAAGVGESAWR
jgi:ketosteroid isomerase-like protein